MPSANPSRARRISDDKAAKAHVYASSGKGPNPFEPGTRRARLWERYRTRYWLAETLMEELADAYGEFRPDKG